MTRTIPSKLALAAVSLMLVAPTWAWAKGPQCELEVHGADFTRPIYEAGHWVYARLDASMFSLDGEYLVPGSVPWQWCTRGWENYLHGRAIRPLLARQDDASRREGGWRQSIGVFFDADVEDLIIVGWIEPLQAGGTYSLTALPGDEIQFEVARNPNVDDREPEPVGLSVSYLETDEGRRAVIHVDAVDASSDIPDPTLIGPPPYDGRWWLDGNIALRSLSGGPALEVGMWCTIDGICRSTTPGGAAGRYVIEHVWLQDRFGNRGDVVDHLLFEDVVIDLTGIEPDELARGTLAPDVIEGADPAPDGIGDDEDVRSPESDDAPTVDDADDPPARPIDPIEDDVDEPAPTAARGSAEGCSATPGGEPNTAGLMALALMAGWRRRRARCVCHSRSLHDALRSPTSSVPPRSPSRLTDRR